MRLSVFLAVFVGNLLPILLAAAAGFVLGKTLRPDIRSVSRLTFYIFTPCLIFTLLVTTPMSPFTLTPVVAYLLSSS